MERKVLSPALAAFEAEMRARAWSTATIRAYRFRLERFEHYLQEKHPSVAVLTDVTPETISSYQLWLCQSETKRGGTLSPCSQRAFLAALKSFFAFAVSEGMLLSDPTRVLEMPKLPRRLPQGVLSPKEIRRLLAAPDLATYVGLRDRAILETLYSTGLRSSELRNLTVSDLDLDRGYVTVLRGKGNKDRVVPVGKVAAHYLSEYLTRARPRMLRDEADPTLFLSMQGGRLAANTLGDVVHRHAKAAGLKRRTFPHGLRHTCATGMLKGRADIRFIQEMLGHESLSSTEIYTHVEIGDLKRVHLRCHPREQDLPADPEWDSSGDRPIPR
jgi:integrase/recombinase XerD